MENIKKVFIVSKDNIEELKTMLEKFMSKDIFKQSLTHIENATNIDKSIIGERLIMLDKMETSKSEMLYMTVKEIIEKDETVKNSFLMFHIFIDTILYIENNRMVLVIPNSGTFIEYNRLNENLMDAISSNIKNTFGLH